MKKIIYTLSIILVFISCNEPKREIEIIDFTSKYKFSSDIENQVAKDTVPWKYQISSAAYANKGDYKNALIHFDLAVGGGKEINFSKRQIDSINIKYKKVNAVDYIVEQSKEKKIIIINEAHHNSFHRFFTKSLLQKLFDNGYTNLGLEALSIGTAQDSLLNNRKYPIQETGYYIKDPQFGNLVRDALEIGYNLFPYENEYDANRNGKQREIGQARNIQRLIESKPNEKFLIHCGYDHAMEGVVKSWEKSMAGRLTEYTGINPLTINQIFYSEKNEAKFNSPFLKALNIKESSVILDQDKKPFKYERGEAWADIAVFHPNTKYINNRPNWLFKNGNKNVEINMTGIEIEFPVMVLAYKKGEDINIAVPFDITEIENKNKIGSLGLKKGNYDIVVTNGKQSLKFNQKVE